MSIFNGRFFAKSIHSQTLRMTICSVLAPFWLVLVWLAPSCSTGYSPGPLTLRLVLGGGRNFQRDRPRDPSTSLRMTICSVLAPFWLVLVWLAPSCSTGYSPGPLTLRLVLGGGLLTTGQQADLLDFLAGRLHQDFDAGFEHITG